VLVARVRLFTSLGKLLLSQLKLVVINTAAQELELWSKPALMSVADIVHVLIDAESLHHGWNHNEIRKHCCLEIIESVLV